MNETGADQSAANENGRGDVEQFGQRRFSRRRVYDRRINIFDEAPEQELSVPDRPERPRSGMGLQGFDESPAPDIGRRTGSPPPSQGQRREQIDRPEIGRNWLVDAVLNPEGEDADDSDPFRQQDGEELESGWGWLADSIDLFESERDNGERDRDEQTEDAIAVEQRELLMEMLGLSDEESVNNEREGDERGHSDEDDLFVDHSIDGRERDLFVDHRGDAGELQERERDQEDIEDGSRDDFADRLAQIFGGERNAQENDDVRLDSFSRDEGQGLFSERDERRSPVSEREEEFRFEQPERGAAFHNRNETASAFRSAFDHNMEHRFRSPLADQQSSNNDSWGRRGDSGGSSFGTPIQPIFQDRQQSGFDSQQWGSDFDRGRDEGRRRDRSLPSSIEQWR